ncbi:MAG: NrfD/PsrC family molybdoenzyme membrane anchor subunit [Pseudomonadota bacterium]|nr:NrfD/PsrC family molybdoenzyme membrane anchor subunit [Pseudomonadota bacterium]
MSFFYFLRDGLRNMTSGPPRYWLWMGFLLVIVIFGAWRYLHQLDQGLIVTNMSNQVSWGFYISNFTFLVGVAAAAVMLAIPAYIFQRQDIKDVVLMGDTMAVTAVLMALSFIMVDLGRPDRVWHLIPGIGRFHFPESMLAWDVVVLSGYLLLNIGISFYILYSHYRGSKPRLRLYFPFVIIAIFWAISIHTVTAFLYSSNSGRAFWSNPLLAPRFIASAFASGPALMIIGFQIIRKISNYPIPQTVINSLALVMAVALQITLFFIGAELFTDFYNEGEHAASIRYLFLGLDGHNALQPWIWTALCMLAIAVTILMIHPLRRNTAFLNIACVLTVAGIWIEKGMGLIIPAYVPTPLGEVYEYLPNWNEIAISLGIWAAGLMIFTALAKAAIPIECGVLRSPGLAPDEPICAPPNSPEEQTSSQLGVLAERDGAQASAARPTQMK